MTSLDDAGNSQAAPADHAGSVLCRLLVTHPEVVDIEILGQAESDGIVTYSLGIMLPGGRELLVDVEDLDIGTASAREASHRGRG